jgi:pimeloyl-ACP methyl ester carboxylesterase
MYVQRAILLASVPPSGVLTSILRYMRAKTKAALKSLSTANAYLLLDTPDKVKWAFFSKDTPDDVVDDYARRLSSESYLAFFNMMFPRIRVRYHRQVPLLVLGAQEDRIFSVAEVRETARKYGAPCHIFPDVAHDMMIDKNPLQIAEFMRRWIEGGHLSS